MKSSKKSKSRFNKGKSDRFEDTPHLNPKKQYDRRNFSWKHIDNEDED